MIRFFDMQHRCKLINKYWTRLRKISWFVIGAQTKWKITDLRYTDKSRHFAIAVFNNCHSITKFVFIFLKSLSDSSRKRSVIFHSRGCFQFAWALRTRISFAAKLIKTLLRLSRPLFVVSFLQVKWWALGQWKGIKITLYDNVNYLCVLNRMTLVMLWPN